MFDDLSDLYQEIILDHGKNPRNKRSVEGSTHQGYGTNPMCGDKLALFLRLSDQEVIEDVAFQGEGCAISQASASLLTEVLVGKTKAQAQELFQAFHHLTTGGTVKGVSDALADDFARLEVLGGVRAFPMRVKCATLAWHTVDHALNRTPEARAASQINE